MRCCSGSTGRTSDRPIPRRPHVWLASFPKSGNTWLRAIVTALRTHRHLFSVDHLGSGSQPHCVGGTLAMGLDPGPGSPARLQTAQPWCSWSSHASSWLADDVPFPVHPVQYEDLKADAVAALAPVFDAIGMGVTRDELAAAVERAAFDRLQEQERERPAWLNPPEHRGLTVQQGDVPDEIPGARRPRR